MPRVRTGALSLAFRARFTPPRLCPGWQLSTQLSRSRRVSRTAGVGHQDAFPLPRLCVRCRFSQRTFAGTRGNGRRDAPIPAIRASESESGTSTDTRRSTQCNLVAPSTFALPSAQISRGHLRLPQCCFRFVESRRFSRLEGVGSAFRYHIPFQRIACFLSDLPSRHAGFHKRLKQ